ncbi:MAG: hypothetical protein F4X57_00115 [Chloroflexi bacterium]|nr:hypothetical protein [Chloroflexota bacterium]
MATRKVSVCYHAGIDMIEVFFEAEGGYYGHPVFDDEYVQPRYNDDGELVGFLIEGARELNEWHDVDLPVVDERQASLKKSSASTD